MGLAHHGTPCALLLALALAGCGNNEPAPDRRVRNPVPAPPALANRFDGRWIGQFTLGEGSASGCDATHRRGMVVQNGVASVTYDRSALSTVTGEIQPDGRVTLLDTGNPAMRLDGRFEGNLFTGSMDAGGIHQRCRYAIEMMKRS